MSKTHSVSTRYHSVYSARRSSACHRVPCPTCWLVPNRGIYWLRKAASRSFVCRYFLKTRRQLVDWLPASITFRLTNYSGLARVDWLRRRWPLVSTFRLDVWESPVQITIILLHQQVASLSAVIQEALIHSRRMAHHTEDFAVQLGTMKDMFL